MSRTFNAFVTGPVVSLALPEVDNVSPAHFVNDADVVQQNIGRRLRPPNAIRSTCWEMDKRNPAGRQTPTRNDCISDFDGGGLRPSGKRLRSHQHSADCSLRDPCFNQTPAIAISDKV